MSATETIITIVVFFFGFRCGWNTHEALYGPAPEDKKKK
jgi:hypothetical protein